MSLPTLLPRPATDDPLATSVERFPLARPRFGQPVSLEPASPAGVRPFVLRFAVEPASPAAPLPPWRYDSDRQIAVGSDGRPWHQQLVDMSMKTTGPSPDGSGNTGNEEWSPDFMSDDPVESF
ncbi:MAG: putative ATP-grasp-modified RiPP [Sciscionella sp.]